MGIDDQYEYDELFSGVYLSTRDGKLEYELFEYFPVAHYEKGMEDILESFNLDWGYIGE